MVENEGFKKAYEQFRRGDPIITLDDSYEVTLFGYRRLVRQEWNRRLNGRFWVGPDIAVAHDLVIPADNTLVFADVSFDLEQNTPFSDFSPYAISCLFATTRSRFAQLGLAIHEGAPLEIARSFYTRDYSDGSFRYGTQVPIVNHSARPIFLPQGAKFFYMYYWDGKIITGEALKYLVGHKIVLSDKEGGAWRWWYRSDDLRREEHIQGIEFLIDPNSRRWIPPHSDPTLMSDSLAENHNRSRVDRYLQQPIPESRNPILWIAETQAGIFLDGGVNGIVQTFVPREIDGAESELEFQTNSVLLRGGNTSGRMRTEIYSPTTQDLLPTTTAVVFARNT